MSRFQLEKLKIHIYGNRLRAGLPQDTFVVMFNPESYSLKYENTFQSYQGINTSGRKAQYSLTKPTKLSLQLILDDSGVVTPAGMPKALSLPYQRIKSSSDDVYKRVQEFLKLTTYMDGELHEPKFLKIEWGDLIFDCRLESVNITYTLFNRSGQPIRANLDTEFVGDIEDSKRLKAENKSSPDLTHTHLIKAGETLSLIAAQIYGNPSYYIQLAQANKLNNFRKLKAGDVINLPPIRQE